MPPPAGHLDVVCLLVSQGAEISCKDKRGYTPLHTAASSGQINVVKHLLNLAVEVRRLFFFLLLMASKNTSNPFDF